MKYVYLGGLILILICLSIVFYTVRKSIKEQKELENQRRDFINAAAHELKTPMTSIGGFIDGILNGTIPPEKSKYYLNIVSEEIKRLTSVVNSMLALAKLESGRTSLVCAKTDIVDIICKVVISFEKKIINKEIQIIGLEDVDRIFVECDKELIYQVVYNLVDNAVKYTHKGGYISIFINEYNSRVELYIKNSGDICHNLKYNCCSS